MQSRVKKLRSLNGKRTKKNPFSQQAQGQSSKTAFPKEQQVCFNYCQSTLFSSGGGAYINQVCRLNSLFDFDYTGVGHQPFQYDQMMAVYNRYRVYTVEISIDFANQHTTASAPALAVIYPSNVNTTVATTALALEQPFSRSIMIGPSSGGDSVRLFREKYNVANILGYQQNIDDDLSAVYTTNPAQVAFLHIVVDHPNYSSSYNVISIIKARFYARVYDLISPGASLRQRQNAVVEYQQEGEEEVQYIKKVFVKK